MTNTLKWLDREREHGELLFKLRKRKFQFILLDIRVRQHFSKGNLSKANHIACTQNAGGKGNMTLIIQSIVPMSFEESGMLTEELCFPHLFQHTPVIIAHLK